MSEHDFCRVHLSQVMREVSAVTTPEERAGAWGYIFGNGDGEFQITEGPLKGFYWHGDACCKWAAKANGWDAWMTKTHPMRRF